MTPSLPPRPSLRHLRLEAKKVLKAHRQGDSSCCEVLRYLHHLKDKSDQAILSTDLLLVEAQFALAMAYGFESWASLKAYVESHGGGADPARGVRREGSRVWLDGLHAEGRWTTHMGCIEGCLRFLGSDISTAWLYGASGHAFYFGASRSVDISDYHFWHPLEMFGLVANLGFRIDCVFGWAEDEGFGPKKRQAWDMIRAAIDKGLPCYGFRIVMPPQYQVISGYDDAGYICEQQPEEAIPWETLNGLPGDFTMCSISPAKPAPDAKAVGDALRHVLKMENRNEAFWGLRAYENWIRELAADHHAAWFAHLAYLSQVWCECRRSAVDFLQEAKERAATGQTAGHFGRAIDHYGEVAAAWRNVTEMLPRGLDEAGRARNPETCRAAAQWLVAARDAEREGLHALACIRDALQGAT
jgi:hypothetical protein